MVMAGSAEQFQAYDELFCIYHVSSEPVVIVGAGRVGRATAGALVEREVDYRIVETNPARIRSEKYIRGDAADLATLEKAGIRETPAVVITTHDDDMKSISRCIAGSCGRTRKSSAAPRWSGTSPPCTAPARTSCSPTHPWARP